jgi:hypothetical protein
MTVTINFDPNNPIDRKVVEDVLKQLKSIEPVAGPKVHLEPEVKADPLVRHAATSSRPRKNQNKNKRWTQADDQFLRDHAGKWYAHRIAMHLGRTVASVRLRAAQLGLSLRKRRKHLREVRQASGITH